MPDYEALYRQKRTTPETAAASIKNGQVIVPGMAVAEPPALLTALADRARAGDLKNITIYCHFSTPHAAKTMLAPDLCDIIQVNSWFVSGSSRCSRGWGCAQPVRGSVPGAPSLTVKWT